MKTYKDLPKTKELTLFESTLINLILNLLNDIDDCKDRIIEAINKDEFTRAKELTDQYKFIKNGKYLSSLIQALWDNADIKTLYKIVNEEKFIPDYTFQEPFLIPTVVLKKFSSYDKVLSNDPKSSIAKKLGATITVN